MPYGNKYATTPTYSYDYFSTILFLNIPCYSPPSQKLPTRILKFEIYYFFL